MCFLQPLFYLFFHFYFFYSIFAECRGGGGRRETNNQRTAALEESSPFDGNGVETGDQQYTFLFFLNLFLRVIGTQVLVRKIYINGFGPWNLKKPAEVALWWDSDPSIVKHFKCRTATLDKCVVIFLSFPRCSWCT